MPALPCLEGCGFVDFWAGLSHVWGKGIEL